MTLTMSRDRNETFIQSGNLGIRQYIDIDNRRLLDVVHNDSLCGSTSVYEYAMNDSSDAVTHKLGELAHIDRFNLDGHKPGDPWVVGEVLHWDVESDRLKHFATCKDAVDAVIDAYRKMDNADRNTRVNKIVIYD